MIDLFEKWLKENLRAMGVEGTIHLIRRHLGDDQYDVYLRTSMGNYHFDDVYWFGAQLNGLTNVVLGEAKYPLHDGTMETVNFEVIGIPLDHQLYKVDKAFHAELEKGSTKLQPRQTGKRSLIEHLTANREALIDSIGLNIPPALVELLKLANIRYPEGEFEHLHQLLYVIRDIVSHHPSDGLGGIIVVMGEDSLEYETDVK